MNKKNIEKISKVRTPLEVDDVPVNEKKSLMDFFAQVGMPSSTFYLRFFQKGFDMWEVLGIDECKRIFLDQPDVAKALLDYAGTGQMEENDKGYMYTLAQSDTPGMFYSCIKCVDCGLCTKFFAFMNEKGMSATTVIKRFQTDNWKTWEKNGINKSLELFYNTSTH